MILPIIVTGIVHLSLGRSRILLYIVYVCAVRRESTREEHAQLFARKKRRHAPKLAGVGGGSACYAGYMIQRLIWVTKGRELEKQSEDTRWNGQKRKTLKIALYLRQSYNHTPEYLIKKNRYPFHRDRLLISYSTHHQYSGGGLKNSSGRHQHHIKW